MTDGFPFSVTVEVIEFVRTLENVTLNQLGVQATFECEVSKDGLKAEWLKDGKPIRSGNNYEMTTDATIHKLVIKKAYAEDEAEYTVVLKDVKSSATLVIKGTLQLFYVHSVDKCCCLYGYSFIKNQVDI